MTKEQIIKHLKQGTDWQMSLQENQETLSVFNDLLREGAIQHTTYHRGSLIPTNGPNLSVQACNFSLVKGFDYSKYEE